MKLTQLKYIVEVAETGKISKAAENLYLSQPSLTAAIKELESEFDITIFRKGIKEIQRSDISSVCPHSTILSQWKLLSS